MIDNKKRCPGCKELKDITEFVTAINTTTGKAARCKECINSVRKDRYHNEPGFKENFHKQRKKSRLKLDYDMSVDDFELILKFQQNRCKICKMEFGSTNKKSPRVDHCHKTGTIRGLLCANCNLGLGNFKDNVNFLHEAITYLKDNK